MMTFLARSLIAGLLFLATHDAFAGPANDFALGADVSWVTEEEAGGKIFRDQAGVATDPFVLLKRDGVNAVRLRVWVDPQSGWCAGQDLLLKAQRATAQGQRLMIDFHYSDSWADPGKQTVPAAWHEHDATQLVSDVSRHTREVLLDLKAHHVPVAWVQVGNEINGGMLWPHGSTSDFKQLAAYLNSGYDAVKSVYPDAQVIVHLANGYDNAMFRWFFDHIQAAGAKWDVIGMSHYPPPDDWTGYNDRIAATMKDMVIRYGKPVVVAETGMEWKQGGAAHRMLSDLIKKTKALGDKGIGVFYWEPEAYPAWQGYDMGALDASGAFTQALQAFLEAGP